MVSPLPTPRPPPNETFRVCTWLESSMRNYWAARVKDICSGGADIAWPVAYRLCSFLLCQLTDALCLLLTYSMDQSPSWEANWFAANQEIPRNLWNPKVHHRIHKCPPSVPILSQLHPVSTPSHFPKIHLNIILPSMSRFPQWSLSFRFPR